MGIFFFFDNDLDGSQTVVTTVERVDDPFPHRGNSNSLGAKFIALNAHNGFPEHFLALYPMAHRPLCAS